MPLGAVKHQLSCPFELTSNNSLIGMNGILVIPGNLKTKNFVLQLIFSIMYCACEAAIFHCGAY